MTDQTRRLVTSLKELSGLIEQIKTQVGGEPLVQNFLSMGTGDKTTAILTKQAYKDLADKPEDPLHDIALDQANTELEEHAELLQRIITLKEQLTSVPVSTPASVPPSMPAPRPSLSTPVMSSAPVSTKPVTRIENEGGSTPASAINATNTVAIVSAGDHGYYDANQDSLGYLHDKVKQIVIAAIADGVSSTILGAVGSSLVKDAALSIPEDEPFTQESIMKRVSQITPQQFAQRAIDIQHFVAKAPQIQQAASNPNMQWDDFDKLLQTTQSSDLDKSTVPSYMRESVARKMREDTDYLANTTLSAYRRKYRPDTNDYLHEVVQIGDSPIESPALGLRFSDSDPAGSNGNLPDQIRIGTKGIQHAPAPVGVNKPGMQSRDVSKITVQLQLCLQAMLLILTTNRVLLTCLNYSARIHRIFCRLLGYGVLTL
jgi:hypothetical protein